MSVLRARALCVRVDVALVRRRSIAVLCLVVGGLMLWSSPALALSQRGHVASGSIPHEGKCELSSPGGVNPGGVAVDESSGEVYVVDRQHEQVDRFSSTGACLSAFKVLSPEGVAVDNSTSPSSGDVYVVSGVEKESEERTVINKFSAEGKLIVKIKETKEGSEGEEFASINGVAIDAKGWLWVEQGEQVDSFNGGAPRNGFVAKVEIPSECLLESGFAVSPKDEFFYINHLAHQGQECQEEPPPSFTEKRDATGKTLIEKLDNENTTGLTVDVASHEGSPLGERANGDVYVDNKNSVAVFDSSGALVQRFGSGTVKSGSGIAVDAANGNVYVADKQRIDVFAPEAAGPPTVDSVSSQNLSPTSTELTAQVDAHGSDTHYYFQYGTVNCTESPSACSDAPVTCVVCIPPFGTPPGPDIGAGFGAVSVAAVVQSLKPGTKYFVRVVASNELGVGEGAGTATTFTTLPSSAGLLPDNRAWEMVSPAEKDGSGIEAIGLNGGPAQASEDGSALTYEANGPVVAEPEGNRSFEPTQVMSVRNSQQWASQDIVTPVLSGEGLERGEPPEYRIFSPNLSLGLVQPRAFTAEPNEPFPLAPEVKEKTMYLRADVPLSPPPGTEEASNYHKAQENGAIMHPPGYLPLVTENNVLKETKFGGHLDFVGATPDLSNVVIQANESKPLTEEAAGSESGLYQWGGGHLHLVSLLPNENGPELEDTEILGHRNFNVRNAISANGARVFWEGKSHDRLYMRDNAKRETIQVNAGIPSLVRKETEEGEEETIGESQVGFQIASTEGSRVFFTDTRALTSDSVLDPVSGFDNPADLYVCEVIENESGKLECKLTDLTVEQHTNEPADVVNLVLGANEEGSVVYFVANGALASGATPGKCGREAGLAPAGATCNLYVQRYSGESGKWSQPQFVTALSNEDSGDWGSLIGPGVKGGAEVNEPRPDLADVTSRVSPNGRFVAFMSDRSLTGYDNIDVHSGKPAQEVYVYDSVSGVLVCASCNPTGAPPQAVFDQQEAGEGLGLVVDRRQDWSGQWLAGSIPGWTPSGTSSAYYQSRYLSNTGRLFFNSADVLVPQVEGHTRTELLSGQKVAVGVERVYEFEFNGEGTCAKEGGCVALISEPNAEHESSFLDASVSGNDAFFVTAQPLVAQDHDTNYDVYDARVCSASSPCLPSGASSHRPCEETNTCRPGATQVPTFGQPSSVTTSTSGNIVPKNEVLGTKKVEVTQAQKLASALKKCRQKYKSKATKKKRGACERQARRKYRAKKATTHAAKKAATHTIGGKK